MATPLRWTEVLSCLFYTLTICAAVAAEAMAGDGGWQYKGELSAFQTDSVRIDGGGKTEVVSYQFQGSAKKELRPSVLVGAGFSYSYHERQFTGAGDFVSLRPWGNTSQLVLSTSAVVHVSKLWSLGLRPFISSFSESGDLESDSISYGTALAAVARLKSHRRIGLGARVAEGIDGDISVKPVLILDWRINDKWLLANPSEPDALGSAGLELVHVPTDNWELAMGGVFHSDKFLLDDRGIAPGGIGEHETLIMFARVSRKWASGVSLKGYIGAALDGTLTAENADGTTLAQSDYDTTPLAGLSIETSF